MNMSILLAQKAKSKIDFCFLFCLSKEKKMSVEKHIDELLRHKMLDYPKINRFLKFNTELEDELYERLTSQVILEVDYEIWFNYGSRSEIDIEEHECEIYYAIGHCFDKLEREFKFVFGNRRATDFQRKLSKFAREVLEKSKITILGEALPYTMELSGEENDGEYDEDAYCIQSSNGQEMYVKDNPCLIDKSGFANPQKIALKISAIPKAPDYGLKMYFNEENHLHIELLDPEGISKVPPLEEIVFERLVGKDIPKDIQALDFYQNAKRELENKIEFLINKQ